MMNLNQDNKLKQCVARYKQYVKETKLAEEIYKWEAIKQFQKTWNEDDPDFGKMFKKAFKRHVNLFYQNSWGFISKAVDNFPAETKEMFTKLYSESTDLNTRYKQFTEDAENILRILKARLKKEKLNHQQDERTISVYLAFRFPEKYFLYMYSFYESYCNLINEPIAEPGNRYQHYLQLANEFRKHYVVSDLDLIALHKKANPDVTFNDENLIVQNILFTMLEKINANKKFIVANITWNSNDWKAPSDDKSNHKYVASGGQPHESWNFDFNNPRNSVDEIFGYAHFTNTPKVSEDDNLIIFYSQNQIVGFYGKAKILTEHIKFNEAETSNLVGYRPLCVVLPNKITEVREKGFLENKKRVGQTGFTYLSELGTVNKILDEAAVLNPDFKQTIVAIKTWVNNEQKAFPFNDKLNKSMLVNSLNQIFFGPPGTGKTYNTINKSIEILDPDFNLAQPRNIIKEKFEALRKLGRIELVTFHQSMSYEDFVEGIKPYVPEVPEAEEDNNENLPTLLYKIEDGIFKRLCTRARIGVSQKFDFDALWDKFATELLASHKEIVFKSVDSELKLEKELSSVNSFKLRFKKSWDETAAEGKSIFHVGKETMRNVFNERINLTDPDLRKWVAVRDIVGSGRATTFYAVYRSFFEHAGLASMFNQKDNALPFVLIIDEINRGNISQIFGELITLIEDDKRQGKPEALEAVLPYSKSKLSVPHNVYIIGTMNTADRSIEALDTALRRRFTFVEMAPKPELISEVGKSKGMVDGIDLVKLLTTINERIEKLIDKDHQIGHSYFLDIASLKELKLAFKNKVVPLLEEYFYGDFGKIGLVLGDAFVQEKVKNTFDFASFKGFDADTKNDLKERKVYQITPQEYWTTEAFQSIY